ncbi:MAG: geranylgeranylglycerol-phosphate geranylgeranyltransferase [Parafilimonas sp.]
MYCVLTPLFAEAGIKTSLNSTNFLLLCLSSVFVAAAGYIINDYFDLNIDRINNPGNLIVEKIIPRRLTILLHLLLSFIGIAIGFYLDYSTKVTLVGFSNLACAVLLFLYSISLKKKLLAGNILISLLTAWVVLVITWCEARFFFRSNTVLNTPKIARLTMLYAGFAFVISLIREVIKDMEDIEGDRQYGCRTMPIVWGLNASKVFVAVWFTVLIAAIVALQFYVLQFHWFISSVWCILFIIIPLIWIFKKMYRAQAPEDFHRLSSAIKLVMLTGILSMIFFRLHV